MKKSKRFKLGLDYNLSETGGPEIPAGSKGTILRKPQAKNQDYPRAPVVWVKFDDFDTRKVFLSDILMIES